MAVYLIVRVYVGVSAIWIFSIVKLYMEQRQHHVGWKSHIPQLKTTSEMAKI